MDAGPRKFCVGSTAQIGPRDLRKGRRSALAFWRPLSCTERYPKHWHRGQSTTGRNRGRYSPGAARIAGSSRVRAADCGRECGEPPPRAVRQKEIPLRLAVGVSRSRLTRQFLNESVLLALPGATLGLICLRGSPNSEDIHPRRDLAGKFDRDRCEGALFFTAPVAIVTGLIFGLAPATQASRFSLNETLKEGGRDAAGGSKRTRLRGLLAIAEVAVSFALLIGAAF